MKDFLYKIQERWDLPGAYLQFLKKYPDKGEFIEDENFVNGLSLYGASELIEMQQGYSYNPIEKKNIDDWPKDYVVIADDGGDPYVLDISESDGEDAPVLFANHGEGKWDFKEYAPSFSDFIKSLKVG